MRAFSSIDGDRRAVRLGRPGLGGGPRGGGGRRRLAHVLARLTDHDALTGLPDRRRLEGDLGDAVELSTRLGHGAALLLIDLDNFKYFNEQLGHAGGDELLCAVARAMRLRLRRTDVLARVAGDEFAVVLQGVDLDGARLVAESLLVTIRDAAPLGCSAALPGATASIGVALIDPQAPRCVAQLLVDADRALYEAKAAGRACVAVRDGCEVVTSDLHEALLWTQRIRSALSEDGFVLYAQPIRELASGAVTRHEILLRMIGPAGEHVAPGEFLPTAERFGLVQAIDGWVVRAAMTLIADRRGQGEHLELQVNLSGASVTDPGLLGVVEYELERTGIDPACLIFEITETSAIADVAVAREFAERLCDLGCRLALDDFGAGFGGFLYLKHLPFDTVKIDGEFVAALSESPCDQTMVRAIAQMAGELNTDTVAECVGDEHTCDLLRAFGVGFAQGFGVGHPRPVRETWPASESARPLAAAL